MKAPRVLILGQEGGAVEEEARNLLSKGNRSDCKFESKRSFNIKEEALKAHFIIMCYHDNPVEDKEEDSALLKQLGRHDSEIELKDQLMVIAENRDELMDLLDTLDIQAFRTFKSANGNNWQKQLLGEVLDWIQEQSMEMQGEPDRPPFIERLKNWLTQTETIVLKLVAVAAGLTALGAYIGFSGNQNIDAAADTADIEPAVTQPADLE